MSNKLGPHLSVILPAYNEGRAVRTAVERHLEALRALRCRFEIVVINDASTDDTLLHAQQIATECPEVRILTNSRNRGQGASVQRGWAEAHGEVVIHNGVDMPLDPADIGSILARIDQGADVVVVERADRRAYGLGRKFVSHANVLLTRLLLRSPFSDHNFTQAYRRSVIETVGMESTGVSAPPTEMILKARAAGFAIDRLPLPYHTRSEGTSTVTLWQALRAVWQLLGLWLILRRFTRRLAAQNGKTPRSSARLSTDTAKENQQ